MALRGDAWNRGAALPTAQIFLESLGSLFIWPAPGQLRYRSNERSENGSQTAPTTCCE
jgi:hypothetical protein